MNVVSLLPNNALCVEPSDLAARLRDVAAKVEAGEFGAAERVIVLVETPNAPIDLRAYGRPTTHALLVGLLEYAKHGVLNPPCNED